MKTPVSPQTDRFIHDRLPPPDQWPVILPLQDGSQTGPANCVDALLERHLRAGHQNRPAVWSKTRCWTYADLADRVNHIANSLKYKFNIQPGNRVLIRGENSPEVVAIWLAIQKTGAVAVTTMSLLRAAELQVIIEIAQPALVLCQDTLYADMKQAAVASGHPLEIVCFGEDEGPLYEAMAEQSADCPVCPVLPDDISILAFTSGTTGKPKATVHFHRDILAICETVARYILKPTASDIFIGTAPMAFTFGLGGLLVFPLYAGASAVLHGRDTPEEFVTAIARYKASICFTVPSYYQQILRLNTAGTLTSLRLAVSSGEALPTPVRTHWHETTGLHLTEVLGSTEMLHAFAGATGADIRPGFIGPAIPGYETAVLDDQGNQLPADTIGRFAVRGPTGCRYLADARQQNYVQNGWNLTGDACAMSADGYVAYHTRYDDMIISSGYNISGLEVENVLHDHPAVAECAVVGEPDPQRGQVVAAYVVVKQTVAATEIVARELQDYVKSVIAPYKYPRRIHFIQHLPRNESGKVQRFRLRDLD